MWAAENPDVLKKICDSGQEIGNHGFYHKMHGSLSYRQNAEEILTCSKLIFEICGVFPTLFAPPSGDFCQDTLKAAHDNGFTTVMWSRDTIDWRDRDSALVLKRATQGTQKGEFILMHPTAHTLAVLEEIVQYYLKKICAPSLWAKCWRGYDIHKEIPMRAAARGKKMDGLFTVSFGVMVNVGSRNESPQENGYAHFWSICCSKAQSGARRCR